jgi:hypothetical protein
MTPFILMLLSMSAFAHFLLVRWLFRCFPALLRRKWWVIGAAALTVQSIPVLRQVVHETVGGFWPTVYAIATVELMIVLIGAFVLGPIYVFAVLARDGARLARWIRKQPKPPAPAPEAVSRRLILERTGGLAVYGITGAALGWGMARGRHAFEVDELVVEIPNLPKALEGYTIAQVSDIHVGVFVGERELDEGFEPVQRLKPDLVVVTGDLVDFEPKYAEVLARKLGSLRARDGVTAILGNHDYYAGADEVLRVLRGAGIEMLVNQGRVVRPKDGGGFALLGVDDLSATFRGGQGPYLDGALRTVPPDLPRILLAHQPLYFLDAAGHVALQLSGHTHGGQINPGFRPVDLLMSFVAGKYERDGSTLYVNRGFGVAGPPARIGAPPEVTKIVLVSG